VASGALVTHSINKLNMLILYFKTPLWHYAKLLISASPLGEKGCVTLVQPFKACWLHDAPTV
jgi:hypothetical protein